VLSGTGSCCFGKDAQGSAVKVGSGGHVVADTGSAFQLSVEALRGVFASFEETGSWPDLGGILLRALQFNEPDDLISWANTATKTEISRLAPEVLSAWEAGDKIARRTVEKAVRQLARQAKVCAKRLGYSAPNITFVLSGSMLLRQLRFQKAVTARLKRLCPGCKVVPLERESAWGAVELAKRLCNTKQTGRQVFLQPATPVKILGLAATEERNPRSAKLDKLKIGDAIKLMLSEDTRVPEALLACRAEIESAIRLIVQRMRKGGRLFYVGAGTSGRLGVLDASECPPTFRTPPDLVQGIMAGGLDALWQSLEGAEDDFDGGARAIASRNLRKPDIVVGIAASGSTPFVWGALSYAREKAAATILISFNTRLRVPAHLKPAVVIVPDVGPEVLTGSTRLKAGTATKLLLNMFSTLSMVRLGKVRSNLMIDLNPSNLKLRERAVRIVRDLTGSGSKEARDILEQSDWVIKRALRVARKRKGH
jgi:N-acetylmuramic acid 6-phosphate etherase